MRRILPTLVLALALFAPGRADALDLTGRFGVGYQTTLSGAQGLTARYQASPSIGLELLGGLGAAWADDDEIGKFDALFVAGGFSVILASDERGTISLGTRVNVGTSFNHTVAVDRVTDIAFEVPLCIEYFVTPHFSLRAGVGLVFAILHQEAGVLGESDELNASERVGGSSVAFGTGEVLGNAGFTVWF